MSSPPPIGRLRFHQRIHVRLTVVYGLALLIVLSPVALYVWTSAVDSEVQSLRAWIRGMVVSIASGVDADRVASVATVDDPYRAELLRRANAVMSDSPRIASIYAMRPTADPATMTFIFDIETRAKPAAFNQDYDASRYPELLQGVRGPVVEAGPVADEWGVSLSGFAPVVRATGETVAVIGIDVRAHHVDEIRSDMLRLILAILLGALTLLAVAGFSVGRMLQQPMKRIIEGTEAIAAGRFDTRVGVARRDEFGVLGGHFDQMAAGLEERDFIRAMFGRYVSEDVARKLLAERRNGLIRGEERTVTILFSDIAGYTTVSEQLEPTLVLGLMNTYIEAMNTIVASHGGCVLEYIGDGILAVFNAPGDLANHEACAVRCAVAMVEGLDVLNRHWDTDGTSKAWKDRGLPALGCRIGVHTGPVVAGSLGSEIRMKYTVMGDSVNLAARLEALNKELGTTVLFSEATWRGLAPDFQCRTRALGPHRVKGREQPVEVHTCDAAAIADI